MPEVFRYLGKGARSLYLIILLVIDGVIAVVALGAMMIYAAGRRNSGAVAAPPGSCRLVTLQANVLQAYRLHGANTMIENFSSPFPSEVIVLDPAGLEESSTAIDSKVSIVSWSRPRSEMVLRSWGLHSTADFVGSILTARRLQDFLVTRKVDVIRSILHDRTALYGAIAARRLHLPHFVEIAGNYELMQRLLGFTYYFGNISKIRHARPFIKSISNWILGYPLRHATRVIGRNKNNYEHGFALGANVDRLSLVRIRIADGFFESHRDGEVSSTPLPHRYILYVARLSPEKRPIDALEIFELVARQIDDVHLVMIGDGPMMVELRSAVEKSALSQRIHILGVLPNPEVFAWSRSAAVGLELYSGSSLVEKMSCGVPIVAYDVEWMSEVVIDGYSGLTADFLDMDGMASACVRMLSSPEEAMAMGRRARELAETMFNRRKIMDREDVYLAKAMLTAKANPR